MDFPYIVIGLLYILYDMHAGFYKASKVPVETLKMYRIVKRLAVADLASLLDTTIPDPDNISFSMDSSYFHQKIIMEQIERL